MTFLLSRFEGQIPVGSIVGNETEVNGVTPAIIGSILLLNTMILGFSVPGPWDSESFTLGIIGMTGLGFWYVAWYRFTFKRKGLIPWLDNWNNPEQSSKQILAVGLFTIALSWAAGNPLQEYIPAPTGLVLLLIGLLISLSGIYSILALGPLADSISEE
tara:strand:+ start:2888 stop:3364 length:477 start_codon:yes stop_codon:yes gene_type:complete